MVADAAEITECPLRYSGKGGVCKKGCQVGSMLLRIALSGRIRLLRYFSRQQQIKASIKPIDTVVRMPIDCLKSFPPFAQAIPAMPSQCAPGEIFFCDKIRCPSLLTAKGLQSQKAA